MPVGITKQIWRVAQTGEDLPTQVTHSALFRILTNFEGNPLTSSRGAVKDVQLYCNPFGEGTGFSGENYNTHDWLFSGWTDYWNWRAEREGVIAYGERLDPNIVKAMAFQESRLGYDLGTKGEGMMQVTAPRQNDLRDLR
jgi:hypothetical protein